MADDLGLPEEGNEDEEKKIKVGEDDQDSDPTTPGDDRCN